MSAPAIPSIVQAFKQFSMNEDPAIIAIAQVYKADSIKKKLNQTTLSSADCLAFPGREIKCKTYFELNSGRVVEVLEFKDGKSQCIGSFNGTAEESCRDGWASYDRVTDAQWCALVSKMCDEPVEEAEDWSCGWNSIQNLFYLKTGMKVSFLELLRYFSNDLKEKTETIAKSVENVKDKASLEPFMPEIMHHMSMMMTIFTEDIPFMTLASYAEKVFFNCKGTSCGKEEMPDMTSCTPQTFVDKIKAHLVAGEGPLTMFAGGEGLLLHTDQNGRPILIDPHNLDRSPGFYAEKNNLEWTVPSFKGAPILLRTQDLAGKKEIYRDCSIVSGLDKDINCAPFLKFLAEIRTEKPLSADVIYEELSTLKTEMEKKFSGVDALLL